MQALRGTPTEWGETWQLALQALRANKVRAMLTMLGVVIGSACIVLVVTVALAGKRYVIGLSLPKTSFVRVWLNDEALPIARSHWIRREPVR